MEKLRFDTHVKCLVVVAGLLLLAACPAMAQISYKTVEKHEQLKRQSLREASQVDVTYKDTHLNMEAYTFKKGESGKSDVRPLAQRFRPINAPDRDQLQQSAAIKEKKFRLFRKKEKQIK
jgi:hypothetical protein